MAKLRVGLLGGSFNPAHDGHRHISELALKRLGLDQVWWLVSPQNPLKSSRGMASLEQRLESARTVAGAAGGKRSLRVSAIEASLGTRYTVDTLVALRRRFGATRFVWLMGADNLVELPAWHRWNRLFQLMPIAIFGRPNYDYPALAGQAARRYQKFRIRHPAGLPGRAPPAWCFVHGATHPTSATALRENGGWIS